MKKATFGNIGWKDAAKGLITAVLTTIATGIYEIANEGGLPTKAQWHVIAIAGVGAGVSYIIKNFLTNSNDQFLKPETTPATNASQPANSAKS